MVDSPSACGHRQIGSRCRRAESPGFSGYPTFRFSNDPNAWRRRHLAATPIPFDPTLPCQLSSLLILPQPQNLETTDSLVVAQIQPDTVGI